MAAPTVIGATTATGTATFNVAKPAGITAGMLLIAVRSSDWDTSANQPLPTGFTKLITASYDGGTNQMHLQIGWKIATGSEPANYSFTVGASSDCVGAILAIDGMDGTPVIVEGTPIAHTSSTYNAPSVTPNGTDDLLICALTTENGNNATAITLSAPSGMTQQTFAQSGNSWTAMNVSTLASPSNPTGVKTFGETGTTTHGAGVTISIKSAAPVDPGWGYYVLEDGTGNLQLEDGSGNYLLDTAAASPGTPVSTTDTASVSIADASSVFVTVSTTDTASVSIADVSTSSSTLSTTDTASVSIADVSATAISSSTTDTASVSIADSSALAVSAPVTTTDTASISIADVSAVAVTFQAISTTDTASISIADASGNLVTQPTTDTASISIADVSSGSITAV